MQHRGFTLVEMLVAVTVAGILGVALTRLLVGDSRFAERQEAMLSARRTARTGMNWSAIELRMVGTDGVVMATPDSVTVRVPYAFGMVCGPAGQDDIVALVPSDSLTYEAATPSGLAWREPDGTFYFLPSVTVTASAATSVCTDRGIRIVPGGRLVNIAAPGSAHPTPEAITYIYQTVTYAFAPSDDLPGRLGLWRRVGTGEYEELAAPFDTSAGFGFLTGVGADAQGTPPADLAQLRGIELRLVGASEQTPRDADGPVTFRLVTQIRFMNRTD